MEHRNVSRRGALIAGAAGLLALPFGGAAAQAQDVGVNAGPKVYLDPGHGGTDPGATHYGLQEKWLTLSIARHARDHLLAHGYQVRMSRNSDVYRSLEYRTSDANDWGASVFVSIHINSNGGTGFESYRSPGASDRTMRLQNEVHWGALNRMRLADSSIENRGKKEAAFYVLVNTRMSAVLTENLFIDTAQDANLLDRDGFREKCGIGHALGIRRFFGENV
ncbi:N-acetylmuramoyl-L-alanine amidase [Glycomyces terrestris]|nr:N-acetylmuramoyl-L-alanine amidase [Glycomyces terrestris]